MMASGGVSPHMQCTQCSTELVDRSLFCDSCGQARAQMLSDESTRRIYCGKCGTRLQGSDKKYCVQCGEATIFANISKEKDSLLTALLNNPKLLVAVMGVCLAIILIPLVFFPNMGDDEKPVPNSRVLTARGVPKDPKGFHPSEVTAESLRLGGLSLKSLSGVARDTDGTLYVADSVLHMIHRIGKDGKQTVYAGTGSAGFSGDLGPATEAELNKPRGLALDQAGNLYVADAGNQVVRLIDRHGTIKTIAGLSPGEAEGVGSAPGGAARRALLLTPTAVGVGLKNEIYVTEDPNAEGPREPSVWILEPEY